MIIRAKAPMRVCFGGGLLDIFPINAIIGGYTVNAAIDKFVTVEIEDGEVLKINAKNEELPRLLANIYNLKNKTITISEDVFGFRGFAQSAALGVALGFAATGDREVAAMISYEAENKILGVLGGYQDQIAASRGGFNIITNRAGVYSVETLTDFNQDFLDKIKKAIPFYSKAYAHSGLKNEEVVNKVLAGDEEAINTLKELRNCTEHIVQALREQSADEFIKWCLEERRHHDKLRQREGEQLVEYNFEFEGVRKID